MGVRNRLVALATIVLLLAIIPSGDQYYWNTVLVKCMQIGDDGAPPVITLLSPGNGSVVHPFSLIDIDVSDNVAVSHVLYHWDLIANETLDPPYDLFARTSEVGHYLYVYANDTSDTWTKSVFYFITDGTYPEIELTTPTNDSLHQSGIDINVTVTDIHLTDVFYSWDNEEILHVWSHPYSTQLISGDGLHTLHVYAEDEAGHWIETNFMFTVDDNAPIITLRDLVNGTARQSGSIVDIDVNDASTSVVLHKWESDSQYTTLNEPFEAVVPAGETLHTLTVFANDSLSRESTVIFEFTGDNTLPEIYLDSPSNGTVHRSGTEVDITVVDTHLSSIFYNWDRSVNQTLSGPILIPSGDGEHILRVYANDTAENTGRMICYFDVDDSPPEILEVPFVHILPDWIYFNLTWIVYDANPESYYILINSTEVNSGFWVDRISVQLVPPQEETYTFWYNCTIILFDSVGNMLINSTWVIVSIWPPEEFGSFLPLFYIGGMISAVVIVALVDLRNRGVLFKRE